MGRSRTIYWVAIAGLILCSFGWNCLSSQFDPFRETGPVASTSRPFVLFFSLIIIGCLSYLVTIWRAVAHPGEFRVKEILGIALLCRVLLLPSLPIQEIDLYRYLWDGYVVNQGINPYRYSPDEIKQAISQKVLPTQAASEQTPDLPPFPGSPGDQPAEDFQTENYATVINNNPEIEALAQLCINRPEVHRVLDIVHFPELPTVYPPVSQAVFAVSVFTTPKNRSRYVRLIVLKSWLMLFDMATLLGILAILKQLAIPPSWAIVYGWSPLMLKEYANAGHLDTITVAFSVWAIVVLIRAVAALDRRSQNDPKNTNRKPFVALIFSAILFACSIAGKLYPVLLTPVLGLFLLRRLGTRLAFIWMTSAVLCSVLFLSPWIFAESGRPEMTAAQAQQKVAASAGLKAFMTRWQVNDLIFSLLYENLLPASERKSDAPWYVVTPNRWRESLTQTFEEPIPAEPNRRRISFLVARSITLLIWLLIVGSLLRKLWRDPSAKQLVHQIFLALAWFWLLAPTQNPWYWSWALPFLLPSHRRAWLGMSCVLFAYYLRFPLLYFEVDGVVPGTNLSGWELFSDIVVWIEFVPLMLWILFYNKTNEQIETKL